MRKWSYALIVTGLALIAFPWAREQYYDWQQERLLSQTEQMLIEDQSSSAEQLAQGNMQLQMLFEQEADAIDNPLPTVQAAAEQPVQPVAEDLVLKAGDRAIAVIAIDKIDLKLPVLEGATLANMKFAAARMSETTPIGKIGNAAIAAHRARSYGRLFNRLDELAIGDAITVQYKGATLKYSVFKTDIVPPTDMSVIASSNKDAILTLITCDPIVEATHRLIVQAKLEPVSKQPAG